MSFWQLEQHRAEAPALLWSDGANVHSLSYGELIQRTETIQRQLESSPDYKQIGLVFCRNRWQPIAAYLAAIREHQALILINGASEASLVAKFQDRYDPDWIFAPDSVPVPGAYLKAAAYDGWTLSKRMQVDDQNSLHPDLALLLSTSGTTGSPKAVRLSFDNLKSNAAAITSYLGISPDDRAVTTLPFSYSYGLSVINSHLYAGAALSLTDASLMTRHFWDQVRDTDVTSIAGVPYTYQILHRLNIGQMALPKIRTLTQAGGKLNPALSSLFCELGAARGWNVFIMYGQTEATARISYVPPERLREKIGSIGIAIPGGTLDIDGSGELVYKGPNVMHGYAECRADLNRGDELLGILRTGDLAEKDAEEYFFLVGRTGRFVKLFGNRVNMDDVEQKLEECFGQPAAVKGQEDRLEVFVTGNVKVESVRSALVQAFQLHHSAYRIRHVDQIPINASGKKDYAGLR